MEQPIGYNEKMRIKIEEAKLRSKNMEEQPQGSAIGIIIGLACAAYAIYVLTTM